MGIMNYCSHDPACALIKVENSSIDYIIADEGFLSRKKKSYQFPLRSMQYCLDYFSIKIEDLDLMTLDYMDFKRSFRTSNNYRLLIGDFLRSRLKIPQSKLNFVNSHHDAHALTAFWPSNFDESTVLIVDGLGSEQQTHSIFYMNKDGERKLIFEQKGLGIGALYSLITKNLGFGIGEEGKTMGLAPYGAKYFKIDKKIPSLKGNFFDLYTDYSNQINRSPSMELKLDVMKVTHKNDVYKPYFSRLAYNLQEETERCLNYLASKSMKTTGCKNLCFAGGVALNCVANEKILNKGSAENFFIYPASGDNGIPFGLALAGLEKMQVKLNKLITKKTRKFFAFPYSSDQAPLAKDYMNKFKKTLTNHNVPIRSLDISFISKMLSDDKIIAICSKGIEIGPRALGHRSFLANARNNKMKDIMNKKIKHRELYRPFAPIVLKEYFNQYFTSNTNDHPYMLMAPKCKSIAKRNVPAICHIDETARVQTVTKDNGIIYDILKKFIEITKIPVLINTSFNDNNEPIVFTKLDAFLTFLKCNADAIVFDDGFIIRKEINEIKKLTFALQNLQEKFKKEYFKKSIKNLTNLNSYTKSSELRTFIKFNQSLSTIYKNERLIIKLIDFLTTRDKNRFLYLDSYHLKILTKLFSIFGSDVNQFCPKLILVNDDFHSEKTIKKNSDFILYNFSSKFFGKFFKSTRLKNCSSFYQMHDKIIKINDTWNIVEKDRNNCIEDIAESYEHNINTTINDFFKKI